MKQVFHKMKQVSRQLREGGGGVDKGEKREDKLSENLESFVDRKTFFYKTTFGKRTEKSAKVSQEKAANGKCSSQTV